MDGSALKSLSSITKINPAILSAPMRPNWPHSRALELCGSRGLEAFTQTKIRDLSDQRYTPCERLVLQAVQFAIWANRNTPCREPHEVYAELAGVSVRQVRRSIKALCSGDTPVLRRIRKTEWGQADALETTEVRRIGVAREAGQCSTCRKDATLGVGGICSACRKQEQTVREVAEFVGGSAEAPPIELVYLGLKAAGSKASANGIRRAYLKLTRPMERTA